MKTKESDYFGIAGIPHMLLWLSIFSAWQCGKGLDRLFNEQRAGKNIAIKNISTMFVSRYGYSHTVISWVSPAAGTYKIALNGTCGQGSLPSGNNAQGVSTSGVVDSVISYSDLVLGSNSVDICFSNTANGSQLTRTLTIIRDDTPPVTSLSPGPGNYASAIAPTISCTDNCDKIAYTLDGSTPTFDALGNITGGLLYTGPLAVPDKTSTTIKFLAMDKAGNQEVAVHTPSLTVDSQLPGLAKISQDHDYVSNSGFLAAQIDWSANRAGLPFEIRVDSTDCTDGYLIGTGTTAATNSSMVLASELSGNGSHTVMFCVTNLVGNVGSFSTNVVLDDIAPLTAASVASGNYAAPPSVNINCSGNCMKTAYTLNGTNPDFDSSGNITNGTAITAAISPPDLAATTIKYRSFSLAGIKESSVPSSSYVVDSDIPIAVVVSNTQDYLSSGGFTSTQLTWSSPRAGLGFNIQKSGTSCATGTIISSGTAVSGTNITTLSNTLFSAGADAVRICLTNLIGNQGASADFTMTLDNTAPIVSLLPASGNYNTVQYVTASCTNNCLKLVYTTDGADPIVSSNGTVSHGTVYSAALTLPDAAATDFRIVGVDLAGNVTAVQAIAYVIDSNVPTITLVSNAHDFVTVNAGAFTTTNLLWNSDRAGLSYSIRIGGTNCTTGTASSGTNGSGTTSAGNSTSVIQASQLATGANTIRVCVQNLLGVYGSTTLTVTRDDVAPTVAYIPTNAAALVSPGFTNFKLTFSEPLASDPTGAFDLQIYDGTAFQPFTVSYTLSYDNSTYALSLTKNTLNDMPYNSQFKQTFTPAVAVTDRAGNPVSGTISATFTTGSRLVRNAMSGTGQTKCAYNPSAWSYDNTCAQTYTVGSLTAPFGQDVHYKFPAINENRSLTRSNDATYTSDYIVTDNVTGIVYQGCLAGQTGAACAGGGANLDTWVNASNFCSTLNSSNAGAGYAGRTNWRLPTRYELQRIMQANTNNPAVDTTRFPAMQSVPLWSINGVISNQTLATTISTADGVTTSQPKTGTQKYICASNPSTQVRSYTDNGDGTIIDNVAGLTWQKCANGQTGLSCTGSAVLLGWPDALGTCENLSLGGFTDWRLPNINELYSLVDESVNQPSISTALFTNAYTLRYWSSTNYSAGGAPYVYGVDLWMGDLHGWVWIDPVRTEGVRCVRGP